MAIYEVKLNRYSPHIKRHIEDELVNSINENFRSYTLEQCTMFDKDSKIVDNLIHTTVAGWLVINIAANYRTNLLARNEQEFLSRRIDY